MGGTRKIILNDDIEEPCIILKAGDPKFENGLVKIADWHADIGL